MCSMKNNTLLGWLRSKSQTPVVKAVSVIWLIFLLYVVIGGTVALVLVMADFVRPTCIIPINASGTYPACKPCGLYLSIFGLIGVVDCPNMLRNLTLNYGVSVPQFFVVAMSLLAIPITIMFAAYIIFTRFVLRKTYRFRIRSLLFMAWLALALQISLA